MHVSVLPHFCHQIQSGFLEVARGPQTSSTLRTTPFFSTDPLLHSRAWTTAAFLQPFHL
jgi:hypothetical protein